MRRQEFMTAMERKLSSLGRSPQEIREILADFEEHIAAGIAGGRTEEDVVAGIGDPAELAGQYADGTDTPARRPPEVTAGGVGRGILAALGLLFFDLLIGLPILFSFFAVLLSLWVVPLAIGIAGCVFIAASFNPLSLPGIFLAFIGVSLLSLTVLASIGMFFLSKFFFLGVKAYIVAHARIVKGGSKS